LDKEEAIFTLRKNKLDLEHEELLQDRNMIVITEFGIPFSLGNILVAIKADISITVGTGIVGVILLGVMEWYRRKNKTKISEKQKEIDSYIRKIEKSKEPKLPRP
jgi:hypothetical protein